MNNAESEFFCEVMDSVLPEAKRGMQYVLSYKNDFNAVDLQDVTIYVHHIVDHVYAETLSAWRIILDYMQKQ